MVRTVERWLTDRLFVIISTKNQSIYFAVCIDQVIIQAIET
jgi:hypothetical protein